MSTTDTRKGGKRPCLDDTIHFFDGDLKEILHPHEDPLIIKADIEVDLQVTKVMVDPRSFFDILYYEAFEKIGYKVENY